MATSTDTGGMFSSAIAATTDKVACEKHGDYERRTVRLGRRTVVMGCPACSAEARAEEQRKAGEELQRQRQARIADRATEMLATAKIPKRFAGRSFDSYVAETPEQQAALSICRDYAETFAERRARGEGLLLAGTTGAGKSHLAAAILQQLMPAHSVLYTTVPELVRSVRDTWHRDSKYSTSQVIESLRALDLLVVDEVGMQTGTDGEQVILYDVLDGRYRDCAPTIMLTNLDTKALRTSIGDRLYDRLRETSRRVVFAWDSYRPRARSQ